MANELDEKCPIKPTQDIPADHAETQPPQINIHVPDAVISERSNSGKLPVVTVIVVAYVTSYIILVSSVATYLSFCPFL